MVHDAASTPPPGLLPRRKLASTLQSDQSERRPAAHREAVVILSTPGVAEPSPETGKHLDHAKAQAAAACARAMEVLQATEQLVANAQAARRIAANARRERRSSAAGRDRLQRSEYARLLARLETMPVIEQAKGIIMAQSACGEAEAFDMLRRASQRSNVPVRDLATQIVAKTATRTTAADPGLDSPSRAPRNTGTTLRRTG